MSLFFIRACSWLYIAMFSSVCDATWPTTSPVIRPCATIPKIAPKPLESVLNLGQIVRDAIREIGYVNDDDIFHADKVLAAKQAIALRQDSNGTA